jgi:hypothetical protein
MEHISSHIATFFPHLHSQIVDHTLRHCDCISGMVQHSHDHNHPNDSHNIPGIDRQKMAKSIMSCTLSHRSIEIVAWVPADAYCTLSHSIFAMTSCATAFIDLRDLAPSPSTIIFHRPQKPDPKRPGPILNPLFPGDVIIPGWKDVDVFQMVPKCPKKHNTYSQ